MCCDGRVVKASDLKSCHIKKSDGFSRVGSNPTRSEFLFIFIFMNFFEIICAFQILFSNNHHFQCAAMAEWLRRLTGKKLLKYCVFNSKVNRRQGVEINETVDYVNIRMNSIHMTVIRWVLPRRFESYSQRILFFVFESFSFLNKRRRKLDIIFAFFYSSGLIYLLIKSCHSVWT